ncbi:sensor histidine kinase [Listeria ilorinensis]|uniref:sensor histidine kinase n=1 Tax=Listeria ilorinensis TaxID=2867439 RepID=UPI003EBD0145
MKLKFNRWIKNVTHVMKPWQIVFFAIVSWLISWAVLQTVYVWMVYIMTNSVVLSGLSEAFFNLFGYGKYQNTVASPLFIAIKYVVLAAIALLVFYFFYRIMRQHNLKLQLRIINSALGNDQPVDTESLAPEIRELEVNIEKMRERQKNLMVQEQRAQQAKNDLITNVSHDLRTPLTSILGYLSYIHEDRYRDEIELRYYTDLVYDKANHLHKLIDDLFSYTRLESPEYLLANDRLNMIELLRQLVAEFDRSAQEKGTEVVEHYQLESLLVSGDGNQIMRLFENLFSNALRYGEEGGQIEINARREGDWAVIDVSNYGEEIPALDLPHLFDRFYKVDKNRTTNGTGLGLAIAKSIVEKHGGLVTADSKNRRTTFTVKLPLINL